MIELINTFAFLIVPIEVSSLLYIIKTIPE